MKKPADFDSWQYLLTCKKATKLEFDDRIRILEQRLADNPADLTAQKRLVTLLDTKQTLTGQLGAYINAQVAIGASLDSGWQNSLVNEHTIVSAYPIWLKILRSTGVNLAVPIAQAFAGQAIQVNGVFGHCSKRLEFFKETDAICAVCHDCYKVQILPANLVAFFQTHFLLLNLDLPRDNARKCMIELREGIKFPYKAYIYCQSIEEVQNCLKIFRDTQQKFGVKFVTSKISHGCSEYGVKYPDFKYSDGENQTDFKTPESWRGLEEQYFADIDLSDPLRKSNSKPFISLRDVFAFCTWVKYAELIGDDTSKQFTTNLSPTLPKWFVNRVAKQAQVRKQEMDDLQQR